ncbi:MAG: MFS transporter [Gammaproteobacteria bacterium]
MSTITSSASASSAALRYRVIVASTIGNAFEWFDFAVFGLFILVIAQELFPAGSHTGSLLLGTAMLGVAFIFRPIGGIVFGVYADRVGRKNAVAVMVLLMALATACMGLIPAYAVIGLAAPILMVAARILQGFSAGGEFSGASALLVEYAPAGQKGYYGSYQMCSQALAVTLAGFSAYILTACLPEAALHAWGWRLPFLFGILVGPVGFYIRRRLQESPEFTAYKRSHPKPTAADFKTGFKDARVNLMCGFGLTVAATASFYVTFIYMPIFAVNKLQLSLAQAALPTMLCGLMLTLICPLAGQLSDRWGRKRMLVTAMILYALVMLVFTAWVLRAPGLGRYLLLQFAATFCMAFLWGPFPAAVTETVPVGVRATGVAIIYNLAVMLFGGLAPFFITTLIHLTGNPMAPAFYVTCGVILSLLTYGIWGRDLSHQIGKDKSRFSAPGVAEGD